MVFGFSIAWRFNGDCPRRVAVYVAQASMSSVPGNVSLRDLEGGRVRVRGPCPARLTVLVAITVNPLGRRPAFCYKSSHYSQELVDWISPQR